MEVLEHGGGDRPPRRRPMTRWSGTARRRVLRSAGVAAGVGAAALLAVDVGLFAQQTPPPSAPAPLASDDFRTPQRTAAPAPPDQVLVLAGSSGLHVAERGRGVRRITGLPSGVTGRVIATGGGVAVVARTRGGQPYVTLLPDLHGAAPVTFSDAVTAVSAADGTTTWVQSTTATSNTARRVTAAGAAVGRPVTLPDGFRLAAELPAGLVLTQSNGLGPILLMSGAGPPRVVVQRGVLLDAAGRHIAWAACRETCVARSVAVDGHSRGDELALGTTELDLDVGAVTEVVSLRLSPDDRHYMAVVRRSGRPRDDRPRYNVVVGHLPDSGRSTTTVRLRDLPPGPGGRAPRVAFGPTGWAVVSDGAAVHAIAPGPHDVVGLGLVTPVHDAMVVVRDPARRP